MAENDSTFLSTEQASSEELGQDPALYRLASRCRKISKYFGWPALIALLLAPPNPSLKQNISYYFFFAAPVASCSILLRLMSQGYNRTKEFVVNGPYRYVRNPVELSALLAYGAAGTALAVPAWYIFSLAIVAALYMSFVGIGYERELKRRHGSAYVKYAARVRRWIPLGLPATNPSTQDYSLHLAILNDKGTWLWIGGYVVVFSIRQHFWR